MFHILKRHPIPIAARFEKALVLTYAFPRELLTPLLSPGLQLDVYEGLGFLAIATVHTMDLRPALLPSNFGRHFFLTNYRLFTRFRTNNGEDLRGLQTLRSDTDSSWLVKWGNRTTRYGYRKAGIAFTRQASLLRLDVRTPRAEADLQLDADVSSLPGPLPRESPFPDFKAACRFAAPLPYTLDYEPETQSMIVVEGVRSHWNPQAVEVEIRRNTFIQSPTFQRCMPVLAGAFYLTEVPYLWCRGRREPLPEGQESMNPVRT